MWHHAHMTSYLKHTRRLCAQGEPESAERWLLSLFAELPMPPPAEYGLALAECNLALERVDRADACIQQVVLDHGDDVEAVLLALRCCRRRSEGSCLEQFRSRMLPFISCKAIALEWLQLLAENLDVEGSRAFSLVLLRQFPHDPDAQKAVAAIAWDLQSSPLLQQCELLLTHPLWWARRLLIEKDFLSAEATLRQAVEDPDSDSGLRLQCLQLFINEIKPDDALDLIQQHHSLFHGDSDWSWWFGRELLARGQWSGGWALYEYRYSSSSRSQILPPGFRLKSPQTLRLAITLQNSQVVVYGEQGLGDTIMFASMMQDLCNEASAVYFVVQPRLVQLMRASLPQATVASSVSEDVLDAADIAASIGSIAQRYCGSGFQSARPHSRLTPSVEARSSIRRQLLDLPSGIKIGLAWRGGGTLQGLVRRSINLKSLLPMFEIDPIQWVNLQYQCKEHELKLADELVGPRFHHFDCIDGELDEMAALIKELDLVITVQQTALHIAGSVDTPAWVMVPFSPEWRYGISGRHMHWYDSVELFRQDIPGDWSAPIQQISSRLRAFVAQRAGQNGPIS